MESCLGLLLDFLVKKIMVKVLFDFIFNDFGSTIICKIESQIMPQSSIRLAQFQWNISHLIAHLFIGFRWFCLASKKWIKTKNTDNHTINSVLLWPISRFVGMTALEPFPKSYWKPVVSIDFFRDPSPFSSRTGVFWCFRDIKLVKTVQIGTFGFPKPKMQQTKLILKYLSTRFSIINKVFVLPVW